MNLLQFALQNKHTSGSALVFGVIKCGKHVAKAWAPAHYGPQIDLTADALESLALLYMGISAGDALQSLSRKEGMTKDEGTALLTKQPAPAPEPASKL